MGILGKSPGDIKYPSGTKKDVGICPEGYSNGLEREYIAESGVEDDEKVDGFDKEPSYKPSAEKQTGDDGKG